MGDRVNLAGKDLIVNTLKEMRGKGQSDFQTVRNSMSSAANSQAIEGLGYIVDDMGGTVTQVTASMSRIGARINGSSNFNLDVYAYNPKNDYSASYSSDYYVTTGYVSGNGVALPVSLINKYTTFQPRTAGTWAIAVRKANALDEAYTVYVVFPSPDANNAMQWTDDSGNSFNPDANGGAWIIGSFLYDTTNGVLNLFVQTEALIPSDFLKNRFMQIMNDVSGSDTTDYINWAIAMGCDAIFKRLAAIEAFVSRLNVNNLTVGTPGNGFSFQALSDDGNGNKVFDVRYDSYSLFRVVVSGANAGKIYFGSGFWYDPSDFAIHSTGDKVVIDGGGSITINEGIYKSNLICPSFRSMPRDTPQSPLVVSYPQNANALGQALQSAGIMDLVPCVVSGDSSIAFCGYSEQAMSGYTYKKYNFYKANMDLANFGYLECGRAGTWTFSGSVSRLTSNVFTFGTASNVVFKLLATDGNVSIQTLSSSLEKGELYYVPDAGGATGVLHVRL